MNGEMEKEGLRPLAVPVAVGLGANLGDRLDNLCAGVQALQRVPHCHSFRLSTIYETSPIGCARSLPFLNAVAAFQTHLEPMILLRFLLGIEDRLGRQRPFPNAPRPLDLDLLLYGKERVRETDLIVPHPRMQHRLFVLTPLREIWNGAELPGLGASAAELEARRKSLDSPEDVIVKSQNQWPTALSG